ncbi:MAG: pyruvate carboxylase [Saprospiraceae bacterium]
MDIRQKFNKLMVANRGEIAIRVFRAATELGIRTVAIYTFEDRYSLHRYKADESYQVGKNDEPIEPYYNIEEIIAVAKRNKVDAIHPGYGFLAENAAFAKRCREEEITFIGPETKILEKTRNLSEIYALAAELSIPISNHLKVQSNDVTTLAAHGKQIGFPLGFRTSSSIDGRKSRFAADEKSFVKQIQEAIQLDGKGEIFIEKIDRKTKLIEVQLLGDNYENLVHLYERDISVQRMFQHVVDVAPSMNLKEETRNKIFEYAIAIGNALKLSGASTVKFTVDRDENIYLNDISSGIQIEHTVTEEITGIDLVRTQILLSMGYPLAHPTILITGQEDVHVSGYGIQCRITTEDPTNNFKPDYGSLIAYRSPGGFGIRLDAGSAYPGAKIPPHFDSLLVKVTSWGRTFKGAIDRLHRALVEFRVRGVTTNLGFLENLLNNATFQQGDAGLLFIEEHPDLLKMPRRLDRSNKLLRFLGNVIVNGNPDIKTADRNMKFSAPAIPDFDINAPFPKGSRQLLKELGPEGLAKWIKEQKAILYTDTTFRDANQSLLASRMRTYDLRAVAESYAKNVGANVFSVEMWGGATYDAAMRYLKENPWRRLEILREQMPNVLLQMQMRGANAVGSGNYPQNLINRFVEESAKKGIDIFRIYDPQNQVENMKATIKAVRERTGAVAEVAICYTGDLLDKNDNKYSLEYYLNLAKQIENAGAHILAINDVAGLLKPMAAELLIRELKKTVHLPVHLHTHDTSGIQSATYLKAIEAGVDIIDVAIASMSGLTSQPNFNSMVAMLHGHERENIIDLQKLNDISAYFETIRSYYQPFESGLRAGTAEVYDHEIPATQLASLLPKAKALGLENQLSTIKKNYQVVNDLLGYVIKVPPISTAIGDMALYMTKKKLNKTDILERAQYLEIPESFKELLRGELGVKPDGFPQKLRDIVLKGEKLSEEIPEDIDFDDAFFDFQLQFPYADFADFLSYCFFPKIFTDWYLHYQTYGAVREIPTVAFFYGLKPGEEVIVEIEKGKSILIQYLNMTVPDEHGIRTVSFRLNGSARSLDIRDYSIHVEQVAHKKAGTSNEIGAPLQGTIRKIFVKEGEKVDQNHQLFSIETMNTESVVTAAFAGVIKKIHLDEDTLVEQDDLILEIDN